MALVRPLSRMESRSIPERLCRPLSQRRGWARDSKELAPGRTASKGKKAFVQTRPPSFLPALGLDHEK